MFGRQNDNQQDGSVGIPPQAIDGALNAEPETQAPAADPQAWQHPGTPLGTPAPAQDDAAASSASPSDPMITPAVSGSNVSYPDQHHDSPAPHEEGAHTNTLLDIKREALTQLTPLVGHLEQTPEERFRTTMMMIQASDDQSLVKDAYAAAQAIEDEAVKAQALLDVINEINYFTQPKPEA